MELSQFNFPDFLNIDISFMFSTQVLLIVLVLFFIIYAIVSGVLIYHWSAYGMRSPGILVAETLFLFVSMALFVFAGLAISYF